MKLFLATTNKGKIQEIQEALQHLDLDFVTPAEYPTISAPQETGNTFEENALQKAQYYYDYSALPSLADDSGIIVEALKSELGIHTRRWGAGPQATDQEWIDYFLKRMEKEENRRAAFVCCLAFIDEHEQVKLFHGRAEGMITRELEADYLPGLPLSACFKPDGFDRVFSALTVEEKNGISHRGRALMEFRGFLEKNKG